MIRPRAIALGLAALLAGGAALALMAVRWRRRRPSSSTAPAGAASGSARLDEDIERYDL